MDSDKRSLIVGLDFDGTVVEHAYPAIGRDIGAIPYLKEASDAGVRIILWTMRSGRELEEAVDHLQKNAIKLWGVNSNPEQVTWTTSPKAYCHLYVDDAALGVPLTTERPDGTVAPRPFIDWSRVGTILSMFSKSNERRLLEKD